MSKLPEIRDEIVENTYQDAITTPFVFIEQAGEHLGESSPALMTARIIDALRMSHLNGLRDTLWHLRMTFFIPECFARFALAADSPPVRIARKTMDVLEKRPIPPNQVIEQRLARLSPKMADLTRHIFILAQKDGMKDDALNMSYTKMLRSLLLLEKQAEDQQSLDPVEDLGLGEGSPSSLILVRKPVMSKLFIAFITTPESFIQSSFEPLGKDNPEFFTLTAGVSTVMGFPAIVTAAIINRAVIEEYQKRGLEIPWVKKEAIAFISKSQQEAMRKGGNDTLQIFRELGIERDEFNQLSRKENPHIWQGLDLLKRICHFNPAIVDNMAYLTYRAWKNQTVINYMRNQVDSTEETD